MFEFGVRKSPWTVVVSPQALYGLGVQFYLREAVWKKLARKI